MHPLLLPMIWGAHVGQWISAHVLSSYQISATAKQVAEEEIGTYGVLAYLIYKVSRLLVAAWPLLGSRWLVGQIARTSGLAVALIVSAWLISCVYVGMLIPILSLDVSYSGLVLSPVIAWAALGYVMLADRVRERRAELEAQAGEED